MLGQEQPHHAQQRICELDARLDDLCALTDGHLIKAISAVTLHYKSGTEVVLDAEQVGKDVGLTAQELVASLRVAKKKEWLAEVDWSPDQQAIRVTLT